MIAIDVVATSGFGAASNYAVHGLPFEPVPGTLNVLTLVPTEVDIPPTGSLHWFGHVEQWWPGRVETVPVAAIGVVAEMPEARKLELFAPVRLRDEFDLVDGDTLTLTLAAL